MPRKSPFVIDLSKEERDALEVRARYAAQGMENKDIAARLDTSAQIVSKWRKRFFEQRLEGLDDAPRHGRPGSFSPQIRGRDQGPGL